MDGSIRVHIWTGTQFLSKDIEIRAIRQFSDNELSSGIDVPPTIEAVIETTDGVLFAKESLDHLCAHLYPHLFNPPPLQRMYRSQEAR